MEFTQEEIDRIVEDYERLFPERIYRPPEEFVLSYGDYVFPFNSATDDQMELFFYEDYEPPVYFVNRPVTRLMFNGVWYPEDD